MMRSTAQVRPAAAALALLLGLLTAGCGSWSLSFGGLDTAPLEAEIEAGIEEGIGATAGIDIDEVECPRNVEPRAGDVFVCRAHAADGSIGTVEVRQVDAEGSVEWELTDVAAPGEATLPATTLPTTTLPATTLPATGPTPVPIPT